MPATPAATEPTNSRLEIMPSPFRRTILDENVAIGPASHIPIALVYDSSAVQILSLRMTTMKKLLPVLALLLFALSPALAKAADITGTWTGEMKGPDGNANFQLSFTFKQDGTKFTGSVQ